MSLSLLPGSLGVVISLLLPAPLPDSSLPDFLPRSPLSAPVESNPVESNNEQAVAAMQKVFTRLRDLQTWQGEVVTVNRSPDSPEKRKLHRFRQRGERFFYVEEWQMTRTASGKWQPEKRVGTWAGDGVSLFHVDAQNRFTRKKLSSQGVELPTNAIFATLKSLTEDKFSELLRQGNESLAPAEFQSGETWEGKPVSVVRIPFRGGKHDSMRDGIHFYIDKDNLIRRLILRKDGGEEEIYFPELRLNEDLPAESFVYTLPPDAQPKP
ncbi:MAG: hypothetical protein OHK0029_22660 [Armatimonadaceae bacterium]